MPDTSLHGAALLTGEDADWYARHERRCLSVLRLECDEADATKFHLGPTMDEGLRLRRPILPHSIDCRFPLRRHPAWDVLLRLLSIAGLIVRIYGVVIGFCRLT